MESALLQFLSMWFWNWTYLNRDSCLFERVLEILELEDLYSHVVNIRRNYSSDD